MMGGGGAEALGEVGGAVLVAAGLVEVAHGAQVTEETACMWCGCVLVWQISYNQ